MTMSSMNKKKGSRSKKIRLSSSLLIFSFLAVGYFWLSFSLNAVGTHPDFIPVHDPYYIKNHPLRFSAETPGVCDVPPGTGEEGPAGIQGLNKIKMSTKDAAPKVKVFCMVYTHSNRQDVLRAIVETYASQCDGFMAASNHTDPTLGAFELAHAGPESYANMWNKVQAMWFFVHANYLLDFDWFHIGGDDMYVIPDNLRRLASHYPPKRPWILGASIPNSKNPTRRFCGGGAGYTLNRKALHLLVQRFASGDCPSETASDEDVRLSRCLEDVGVKCQDTNDLAQEMRYHHLDVQFHAGWVPTRHSLWLWEKLQYFHGIRGNQTKLAQISNTSVSFHLDKSTVRSLAPDRGLRRYHAILHDLCSPEFSKQVEWAATCHKDERDKLQEQWKKVPKGHK